MNLCKEDNFIGVYDNILSKDICGDIISEFNILLDQMPPQTMRGSDQFSNDKLKREDYSLFVHKCHSGISKIINNALNNVIEMYSNQYWVVNQIPANSQAIKLQKTPPRGGYHVWHTEQFNLRASSRVLAWTIYLNDVPSGEGETEFLWQKMRISPKAGRASIWPAAFTHTHRGNPVYSCEKYISTGWFELME